MFHRHKHHHQRLRCLFAEEKMRKKRILAKNGTRILSKVRKSWTDIRDYRAIELANGMVALLVHDRLVPTAGESEKKGGRKRKSAGAMTVGVGNLHSPKEVQGIAHMLEHMLTMGSEKFQKEAEYKGYIDEHGGNCEEATDADSACYSFEVNGEYLNGALERFSQCFVSPLLSESTLKREIQAVDEEFQLVKGESVNILERLRCHTSEENHLYNKFLPGNIESLIGEGDDYTRLRNQISAFHQKHYRGRNLKLVLIGGEPLDVLQDWVEKFFSSISKGPVKKAFIRKPIHVGFRSQKRKLQKRKVSDQARKLPKLYPTQASMTPIWKSGKLYKVVAETGDTILEVSWTLPCLHKLYRKKPEGYMSHFLGHEGEGSLLSLLKARGWATSLTAGVWDYGIYRTSVAFIFLLTIHLTSVGLEHFLDIIGYVYQYLKVLRNSIPESIFEEVKCIGKMEFTFGDEETQNKYATKLSGNLLFSSPKHVIGADYVVSEWDDALIRKLLCYFIPKNMRVDVLSDRESLKLKDSKFEPWSEICYSVEDIGEGFMKQLTDISEVDALLHLPSKNRFIPTKFQLCAEDTHDVPTCIVDEERIKFWYKKDNTFKVPLADVYLRINFKEACLDVMRSALTEFFIHLLKDELSALIEEANIAMLKMVISFIDGMFELKVSGFSEKLSVLLSEVLLKVGSFIPTEKRFEAMKEDMQESLKNQKTALLKTLLCEHNYDNNGKLFYLDDELSLAVMEEFIEDLRSQLYIEGLCHGNFTKRAASDICDMIRTAFQGNPLHVDSRHAERVVCIPPNANSVMDFNSSKEDDKISVAELYYQLEQDSEMVSAKWMALFDLFNDIIQELFFDRLRTEDQLGYDVECSPLILHGVFGFFFEIKSSKKDPESLLESIDNNFIKSLEQLFENLDDKKFNNHKNSLVVNLMDKASSLKGESDRLWTTIKKQRAKFDIGTKKAEEVKKIKKADMIEWCGKYFNMLSPKCRRLNVRFWGAGTSRKADDSESEFARIEKFKKEKGFWGAPQA